MRSDLTLADFLQLISRVRGGARLLRRLQTMTFAEFTEVLYADMDVIFRDLEQNREERQNDSEDRLTVEIMVCLRQLGYLAEHDAKSGGHVDLTVAHSLNSFRWLGEAKNFKSVSDLREGFLQLTTRYSVGDPSEDQGGLFAYLRRPDAKTNMDQWRNEIKSLGLKDLKFEDCPSRGPITFYTSHIHESSGVPYRVRHMCLMLHFNPSDRSGRRQTGAAAH